MRVSSIRLAGLTLISVLVLGAGLATAKPPTLTALEPAGARQGTAALVKAAGTFDHWPVASWVDDPGLIVTPSPDKGMLWIEASSTLSPGVHWLRLRDEEGATALRPFLVGTLPEINEVEPNDDPASAPPIDRAAVTINGVLSRNRDVDGYAVRLRKGETLVASLEANRRLGSPMDGLLQITRPDGIVLAENDDDHGRDPQLVFQAPEDGTYVARTFAFPATPDSRIGYSGGSNYIYRLTLTTGAFVDHAYPLALRRGESASVKIQGWNLSEGVSTIGTSATSSDDSIQVALPALDNTAEIRLVDHATATEVEPNPPDHPQPIAPPLSLSGHVDEPHDLDAFLFQGKKGEKLTVRVDSRSLGQPLDPAFRILDSAGKIVAEADDSGRDRLDAEVAFTPPADGDYRIVVRDLNRQGGPRAAYLLTIAAPKPDYQLSLDTDRFVLTPGKPLSLTVKVDRSNGFDGVVEVTAIDLPEGVTATAATSEAKGDSSKSVKLSLQAASPEVRASGPFQIVGRVKDEEAPPRRAGGKVDGFESPTRALWLSVVKADADKPSK